MSTCCKSGIRSYSDPDFLQVDLTAGECFLKQLLMMTSHHQSVVGPPYVVPIRTTGPHFRQLRRPIIRRARLFPSRRNADEHWRRQLIIVNNVIILNDLLSWLKCVVFIAFGNKELPVLNGIVQKKKVDHWRDTGFASMG